MHILNHDLKVIDALRIDGEWFAIDGEVQPAGFEGLIKFKTIGKMGTCVAAIEDVKMISVREA